MVTNKKVWVEVDRTALKKNIATVRSLIAPRVKLWAVIKSNAYGHGLLEFSRLAHRFGVDGFCVDSVIEGLKLRQAGIKKDILVLGPTLTKEEMSLAAKQKLTLTISTKEALTMLARIWQRPTFHIKVDTGMHRQGFYVADLKHIFNTIRTYELPIAGIYTHFSSVVGKKDIRVMDAQFAEFLKAVAIARNAGYTKLIQHVSATAGLMTHPKYHLDAVRVGKGLYGLWPSTKQMRLLPVLSWRTVVSEVKTISKGAYIGYARTEMAKKNIRSVLMPIGYWHGFPRGLSSCGVVLIRGKHARVLGRVSMDITVLDASHIPVRVGDRVTLIGTDGSSTITAETMGSIIGMSNSETTTRINPLIARIPVY